MKKSLSDQLDKLNLIIEEYLIYLLNCGVIVPVYVDIYANGEKRAVLWYMKREGSYDFWIEKVGSRPFDFQAIRSCSLLDRISAVKLFRELVEKAKKAQADFEAELEKLLEDVTLDLKKEKDFILENKGTEE